MMTRGSSEEREVTRNRRSHQNPKSSKSVHSIFLEDEMTPKDASMEKLLPRDWRQALRTPHPYRVGNSMFRLQTHYLIFCILLGLVFLYFYGFSILNAIQSPRSTVRLSNCNYYTYDRKYPLTDPSRSFNGITFNIAIISDLDQNSKSLDKNNIWQSYLKRGQLTWMPSQNLITVRWDKNPTTLTSTLSMAGRGMELSELVVFDGKLLSFDDRTGAVFIVDKDKDKIYPWLLLMDGDGHSSKGFKSEWATVKDDQLYIGSMGKEWTTATGEFVHDNPLWIKIISPRGEITSENWSSNYKRLREAIDIQFPGYMIHESGAWSNIHQKWFFLPRRCSKEQYNEVSDELMSCNVLLIADENFENIEVKKIGMLVPVRGYSSFKFLPESRDSIIVALKSEEYQGKSATYMTAFTIDGRILMPDLKVAEFKYEGLEFI